MMLWRGSARLILAGAAVQSMDCSLRATFDRKRFFHLPKLRKLESHQKAVAVQERASEIFALDLARLLVALQLAAVPRFYSPEQDKPESQ
eukprot:SAG31_NODE_3814_length_3859_cov_5.598936_2_plen_90_part_00